MTKTPVPKNPTPRAVPRKGQIAVVNIAKNGMLSAADENGTDLPQFGGPSEEVLPMILRVQPDVAVVREE